MTELPPGWIEASLVELAVNRDRDRVPVNAKERSARGGEVPYYGAAGQVGWIDRPLFDETLLLLGEDGVQFFDADKTKAYLISGPSWVNNHAHVLGECVGVDLRYLMHYLNQFDYHGYANGTTRLKLTRSSMDEIPVRIAPSAEQDRIAMAIEEAFSKVDAGEAGLRTVRQLLKRMRGAILAAAVTGQLVPQDPTDTPAAKLLADLGVDRTEHDKLLPPLPENWAGTTVGAISQMSLGKMLDAKSQTGQHPTPYLRNINVRWGSFDLDDLATMDIRPDELERVALAVGDLVVCEGGEPGRCAVWRHNPVAIQKALHRLRPMSGISSDYLALVLAWWTPRSDYERYVTGTTIRHIPKEKLKLLPVPLPPSEEQSRIVTEVERQSSFLDACEREVDAGLARSAALRRSVLKAAFEGKLAPQDPGDEAASALLERIRADRLAASTPGNRRARTTA